MNKLLLFLIFLLTISSVQAITEVNLSGDINSEANHTFNLSLNPSQEAYINLINSDTRIDHNYTQIVNSTNSLVTLKFKTNSLFTENETINETFQISNNETSTIVDYPIQLNIYVNSSISETIYYNLSIEEGEYIINTTDENLPLEEDLAFKLKGTAGEQLNVSCEADWLSCTESHIFNENNEVDMTIHVLIPENTSVGIYTIPIFFETINQTISKNIKIYLNRKEVTFEPYEFGDACTIEINGSTMYSSECVFDMQEYYLKVARELTERLNSERNKTCVGETEYIVAGNVTELFVEEYDQCKLDRNEFQDKYVETDTKLSKCSKELDTLQSSFVKNESECWQNLGIYKEETEQDSQKYIDSQYDKIKSYRNRQLLWVWTPVFLFIIFLIYLYYKKNNHEVFNNG